MIMAGTWHPGYFLQRVRDRIQEIRERRRPTPPSPPAPPIEDTDAPAISFSYTPQNPTTADLITIRMAASDDMLVSLVYLYINDQLSGEWLLEMQSFETDVSVGPFVAGSYTIKMVARDSSGNESVATSQLIVTEHEEPPPADVTPPVISAGVSNANPTTEETITLSAMVRDENELSKIVISVDTTTVEEITPDQNQYTIEKELGPFTEGQHIIRIVAIDPAENSSTWSLTIVATAEPPPIVDTEPPVVQVTITQGEEA